MYQLGDLPFQAARLRGKRLQRHDASAVFTPTFRVATVSGFFLPRTFFTSSTNASGVRAAE